MSKRFTKTNLFREGTANTTIGGESITTANKNNEENTDNSSLMVRTKSLGNIFNSGSLSSLRRSLRPSVVPSLDDEERT